MYKLIQTFVAFYIQILVYHNDLFLYTGHIDSYTKYIGWRECIQYADDCTIYHNSKIKNINKCSNEIKTVKVWSKDAKLVFNPNKTKAQLSPTRQFQQIKY